MKTILLTGSNGFTGKYIKDIFQKNGYRVAGLSLSSSSDDEYSCDLTDKSSIRSVVQKTSPDGIIHLAALSFVAHDRPLDFYNINVLGTMNLLDALEEEGITADKILIASSANIYGNPETENVTEETPPSPVNHYATSKLAMEHMVKTKFDRQNIIITRPFNYTGPGQDVKFLVAKIVDHYRRNERIIELGNTDIYRNFSDVRDIARAYLALFESDIKSEIINLSSGEVFSINDIINLMNEIAGYKIEIKVNQAFVRDNDIRILNGSNNKLKQVTGFVAEYSLETTLQDMYSQQL